MEATRRSALGACVLGIAATLYLQVRTSTRAAVRRGRRQCPVLCFRSASRADFALRMICRGLLMRVGSQLVRACEVRRTGARQKARRDDEQNPAGCSAPRTCRVVSRLRAHPPRRTVTLQGCNVILRTASGSDARPTCPFGFTSEDGHGGPGPAGLVASIRDKQQRVTMLYEEYIHLDAVRAVWSTPKTEKPQLEPVFAAAMHAIEIGVMLMATFVRDNRAYVTKRQRIDAVARCLEQQCILVADLVDASSSEDGAEQSTNSSRSLSQAFPFPNCPPTVAGTDGGGAQSACLAYLIDAVRAAYGGLEPDERRALRYFTTSVWMQRACQSAGERQHGQR